MKNHRLCFKQLAVAIFTTIAFYANDVSAQIVPDATLPNNSRVTSQDNIKVIGGGTQAGSNLFHSFEQFSVPTASTAYFNNTANIQNIITRITGKSVSNIDGILRANGSANLFLINPNGIIFGKNSSLDIGGSFLGSTASSINFADGTKFSARQPQTTSLLTIKVPIGLQFGAAAAPIRNQSQASPDGATNLYNEPVGLQVSIGKTLALIGGDITLEGGNLTANSGQIELGSVAGNSVVSLKSINNAWVLGYEGVDNFGNIQIIQGNIDNAIVGSIVDAIGKDGGGSIRLQGDSIELIGFPVLLNTATINNADAGNIKINARKLIIRDGAQIQNNTFSKGAAGNLTVNASESVELIGAFINQDGLTFSSGLSSTTFGDGRGGNLTINTSRLLISDGAIISAGSSANFENSQLILATGKGGNLTVNASEVVELVGKSTTGFSSELTSGTVNSADAGNLTISTKRLIVRDGAQISVGSKFLTPPQNLTVIGDTSNLGNAGEIDITADSILLDNQGQLISETESANGGNINLQLQDLLVMRRNSQISTNAGIAELDGDGGNITINIPDGFIVAIPDENSDITANAFTGTGGKVEVNATGIFGIQPRSRDELTTLLSTNNPRELNPQELITSDITAISQQNPNLNGILSINVTDVEPTRELVELPDIPLDSRISQVCRFRRGNQSEFIYTRRGGLPPKPGEVLKSDSPLDVDWVSLEGDKERGGGGDGEMRGGISIQNQIIQHQIIKNPKLYSIASLTRQPQIRLEKFGGEKNETFNFPQNQIVEATGWVVDENGDLFFVARKPNGRIDNSKGVGC